MIRHYYLTILFLLAGFVSFAQYSVTSKYFVYLQTEPAQPFYIKINGQQLSANASGYLILPQLKDGDYKLVVGFPQEKFPQQTYNFAIDSKDKGYLIKDFGAEGWGLFDLQTMAVQKPMSATEAKAIVNAPAQQPQTTPKENVSDFTKVLSKAANDPSLLETPKEEPKPVVVQTPKPAVVETPKPAVVETPKPVIAAPAVVSERKEEVAVIEQSKEKPVEKEIEIVSSAPQQTVEKPVEPAEIAIEKPKAEIEAPNNPVISQAPQGQSGVRLVYNNKNEKGETEPVTIFIPEPKTPVVQQQPKVESTQEATTLPEEHPEVKEEQVTKVDEKKSFEVEEKPAMQQEPVKEEPKVVKTNSACKRVADESDFLKLRRQMSQKDTDDGMIGQAATAFKSKCYTTAQIKYLSSMFLSNAGKYNFYQSAVNHIADPENFATLRSELKDDYYIGKFDGLVGK